MSKKENEIGPNRPAGMLRRIKQPVFEESMLTPGGDIPESFVKSCFADQNELVNAVLYIGQLRSVGYNPDTGKIDPAWQNRIDIALYKINGNVAINARARDDAVQAHGGMFWPKNATKEERKQLAKQFKDKGDDQEGNRNNGHGGD